MQGNEQVTYCRKMMNIFSFEIWNSNIVTLPSILRLSRDFQVASGRGNWSTQRKPPPNINAPAGI